MLTIRFPHLLDPFSHGQRLSRELWPEGGQHTTHSRRTRVAGAQITFDDRPQSLAFGCSLCSLQHARSHLIERSRYRFNEKIILACKMPVEAPFCQAYLLHHRTDATRVPAVLPDRAGSHGKNLLAVPRFVF